jgi:hypothetical protein
MKMKRLLTLLFAFVIIASLTACGGNLSKPKNGTYKSEGGLLPQTWTFSSSNELTVSTVGGLIGTSGTYTISGNKLTFTATGILASTTNYAITEITSKSFFIDGTKFTKQ